MHLGGTVVVDEFDLETTIKTQLTRLLANTRRPRPSQAVALAYETGIVTPGAGNAH
jgi:hypothetical protein